MVPMPQTPFEKMLLLSAAEPAMDKTVLYLTEFLRTFVQRQESVLICFPRSTPDSLGALLERAVLNCEAVPVFWENDLRWQELLRLAFLSRATTVIGAPMTVLGLSKLANYRGIPLFLHNVVISGYPCHDWMLDGIISGLDCRVWGILSPKLKSVVAGASCACDYGIHLRDDEYGMDIVDENGNSMPSGQWGRLILYPQMDPMARMLVNATAMMKREPCACGSTAPKIIGMDYSNLPNAAKFHIMEEILYWNSVLDCWVERTDHGMEIEVICLPGLKLPKFPSCSKLLVRPWNAERDIPYEIMRNWKDTLKNS